MSEVLSAYAGFPMINLRQSRSKGPRGLRCMTAVTLLLKLWVRIPPGGMNVFSVVSVVCCPVEISATS